jgi:hypothetical protein
MPEFWLKSKMRARRAMRTFYGLMAPLQCQQSPRFNLSGILPGPYPRLDVKPLSRDSLDKEHKTKRKKTGSSLQVISPLRRTMSDVWEGGQRLMRE